MYPDNHVRFTWGGSMYGRPRAWQNNLRIIDTPLLTDELLIEDAGFLAVSAVLLAFLRGPSSTMHENVTLDYIQMTLVGRDGAFLDGLVMEFDKNEGRPNRCRFKYPPQVSIAATLHSTAASTLARTGRIYLPIPDVEVMDDGNIRLDVAQNIAVNLAYTLRKMNEQLQLWWPMATFALVSPLRDGRFAPISSVSVGTMLDTMQSRKKDFTELYSDRKWIATAESEAPPFELDPGDFWAELDDIFGDLMDELSDKDYKPRKRRPKHKKS